MRQKIGDWFGRPSWKGHTSHGGAFSAGGLASRDGTALLMLFIAIYVGQLLASDRLVKRAFGGSLAQPFHIAHGREAKQAFVFPVEVRRIIVAHAGARAGRVEVLVFDNLIVDHLPRR